MVGREASRSPAASRRETSTASLGRTAQKASWIGSSCPKRSGYSVTHAPGTLACIGPVRDQPAASLPVIRAGWRACGPPRLAANLVLGGEVCVVTNPEDAVHGPATATCAGHPIPPGRPRGTQHWRARRGTDAHGARWPDSTAFDSYACIDPRGRPRLLEISATPLRSRPQSLSGCPAFATNSTWDRLA